MARSRVFVMIAMFAFVAITFVVAAANADAAARSWDRQITDGIGRPEPGTPSTIDSAIDGDYVYWTMPTGKGPASKHSNWVLRQMTMSTGTVRRIATVRNGVFGNIRANAGRVAFSSHRRQRSRRGGKLVTTKSLIFSMAATDPRPSVLASGSAVSRFELQRVRRRTVTVVRSTCGKLPVLADVSDTGQALTISRTLRCKGAPALPQFRVFEPGSTTPVSLGGAGLSFQAAIRQNKLIDLGDDFQGSRGPSVTNLATGAVTELPEIGIFSKLIHGPFRMFAIRSSTISSQTPDARLQIFSLDTDARSGQFKFDESRSIDTFALCSDAIAQVRETMGSNSEVILRDGSGTILGRQARPKGDPWILGVSCVGRTVSIVELPAAADGTLGETPRLVSYAF